MVGDVTSIFRSGQTFEVVGSTGNDGTYTVQSSVFATGNTNIVVNEPFADAIADGTMLVHIFVLNGDVAYRFIPTFTFDVINSSSPLITNVNTVAETFTISGD